jgi:hypothetical protein
MTLKNEETLALFVGRWIGETQGYEMPAHIWEITRQGNYLWLMTRWEGETQSGGFYAEIVAGELAFKIRGTNNDFKATLLDKQHFVIPGWCTNDVRNNQGPSYDVIFSRPGIAELTAREVYLKSLESKTD